jgi:hypothetical protein
MVTTTYGTNVTDLLITGFAASLTRRVSLVEQELLTLSEHPRSTPVFGRVRVTDISKMSFRKVFIKNMFAIN